MQIKAVSRNLWEKEDAMNNDHNFSKDSIETMKRWYREYDGTEINDDEAVVAWKAICEYFEILDRWDKEAKQKDSTP